MQFVERAFLLIALTGFLLKVMLIPGGDELLLIGCTLTAFFYWLFSFAALNHIGFGGLFKKQSYASISPWRILGAIIMGIGLCTIVIGILFGLLLLYGATEMITVGATALMVIVFVTLLVMIIKKRASDRFYHAVLIRGVLALVIGMVTVVVPVRMWISLYHRDDPTYRDLYIKARENPMDLGAQADLERYRIRLDSVK